MFAACYPRYKLVFTTRNFFPLLTTANFDQPKTFTLSRPGLEILFRDTKIMEFLLLREICYPESTLFRIHHFSVTKKVSPVFSLLRGLLRFLLASYKIPLKMQNKLHYDVPIKEVLHQQMKKILTSGGSY